MTTAVGVLQQLVRDGRGEFAIVGVLLDQQVVARRQALCLNARDLQSRADGDETLANEIAQQASLQVSPRVGCLAVPG